MGVLARPAPSPRTPGRLPKSPIWWSSMRHRKRRANVSNTFSSEALVARLALIHSGGWLWGSFGIGARGQHLAWELADSHGSEDMRACWRGLCTEDAAVVLVALACSDPASMSVV